LPFCFSLFSGARLCDSKLLFDLCHFSIAL
jgi:hypothetical protein